MNRLKSPFLGMALLLLGASQCIGEETKPGPDYEKLKAMEWIIGDWEADWVVPSGGYLVAEGYPPGTKVHSTCSYSWMENKNYIGLKFRDVIDGKVAHQGFEMVGVDPQSKKIIHWLSSILGGWGTGEWSVEGRNWILKWSGTTADGTTYEGVSYHVPIDPNTYTWEMKESKKNRQNTPDTPLITFSRVKTADKPVRVPEKALAALKFFVGSWEGKTFQNGDKIGTNKGKRNWLPGKHSVKMSGSRKENGTQICSSGISGWDANGNQLVEHWFDSDGLYVAVRYPLGGMKDDKWEGNFSVTFGDGRKFNGKCVLRKTNDGYVWTANWKEDGKKMVRKSIARRMKVKSDTRQASNGEKAFKEFVDIAVGGVWTTTVDGQTFKDSYKRILDGRFVRLRSKGTGDFTERITILGVDPVTGKFTWRGFAADGSVTFTRSTTLLDDGTWRGDYHSHGPKGSERSKFRVTKVDDDTIKLEISERVVEGDANAFPSSLSVWKRKR